MKRIPEGGGESVDGVGRVRWDLLLLLLLSAHLIWIFSHFLPITVGPDAGGLFVQARLIATESTTGFRPESPMQFLGTHWMETPSGVFQSRYPPGFPLLLAAAFALGGPRAPFYLNPILATCAVGLTYLVGRRFMGKGMALWAATLVATLPILNRLALHGDAHVAATAFLLLGVWLLFRWEDEPTWQKAFLAGLAFGILPTVRYPEAVVGFGVIAFFAFQDRGRRWVRGFLPATLGAAFPLLLLGFHNARVYGAPWRTGYGFTNEQSAFSFGHLATNAPTYLNALVMDGAGLFFLLGSAGIVWMFLGAETRPKGALFLGAVASLTLLYSAYYWGAQEEAELTLRYFLATLPLLVLGTLWLVQRVPYKRISLVLFSALTLLHLSGALPKSSDALLEEWVGMARGQAVTAAVTEMVPPGSVLIARREIQDMLDYFGLWRLVDDRMIPGTPGRLEATLVWELSDEDRARWSGLPTPVQITKGVESRERYVGLGDRELSSLVLRDLRDWAGPGAGIYWIGNPRTVRTFGELAADEVRLLEIGEVPLPGWGAGVLMPAWVPKAPLSLFELDLDLPFPLSQEIS